MGNVVLTSDAGPKYDWNGAALSPANFQGNAHRLVAQIPNSWAPSWLFRIDLNLPAGQSITPGTT